MTGRNNFLITAQGHDGSVIQTLTFSTLGITTASPAVWYEPRVIDPGNFERHMFAPGTTRGAPSVGVGDVVLASADAGRSGLTLDYLLSYAFDGRRITIAQLPDFGNEYGQVTTLFTGTIEQLETSNAYTKLSFKIHDTLTDLENPVLSNTYGGTTTAGGMGTADGNADLAGVKKQRCYGNCRNVTPQVANAYDLVYQATDGPVLFGILVYDGGLALTFAGNFSTLATLLAWTQVAGYYVTCTSLGLFRLGTAPDMQITCDVFEVDATTSNLLTSAGIVKHILQDFWSYRPASTTEELSLPLEQWFVDNGRLVGGSPAIGMYQFIENSEGISVFNGHDIIPAGITKTATSKLFRFSADFKAVGNRGIVFRLAEITFANCVLTIINLVAGTFSNFLVGTGWSIRDTILTAQSDGWYNFLMVGTTDASTTIIPLLRSFDLVNGEAYHGDGVSGFQVRNLSYSIQNTLDDASFDLLDRKTNYAPAGYVVTGDETALAVSQAVLDTVGGYLLPNSSGVFGVGRLDPPAGTPASTANLFPDDAILGGGANIQIGFSTVTKITSPDAIVSPDVPLYYWKEDSTTNQHYIFLVATGRNVTQPTIFEFTCDFLRPNSRNVSIFVSDEGFNDYIYFNINLAVTPVTFRSPYTKPSITSVQPPNQVNIVDYSLTRMPDGFARVFIRYQLAASGATTGNVEIGLTSSGAETYLGGGTDGLFVKNLSLRAVDPSVLTLDEDNILGTAIQRLATGDAGNGIPYWQITTRYQYNNTVMNGSQVLGFVTNAQKALLAAQYRTATPVSNASIKTVHLLATELVADTEHLDQLADATLECNRLSQLYGVQRSAYQIDVALSYVSSTANIGDTVLLQNSRFGLSSGKNFIVIGRVENYADEKATLILWG